MQAPITSPDNPLFPPASDTLIVDSFNGIPYNYRWVLAVSDVNGETVTYNQLMQGNGSLTADQWTAWTTQPDTYLLECAAKNLGVDLA